MNIAARSLKIKRTTITKLLEAGLYPYTKRYLGSFRNHFSTIGLVGMNEACLNANWLKKDLTTKESHDFAVEVLNYMRTKLSDYQELYGDLYNLEATPAESTAYRLAKHDKSQYSDIICAYEGEAKAPYYTNSSHLPVGFTKDLFEALDLQDDLHTLYTSGTVFHAFLGQKLDSWEGAANLVRKIASNYKLPYFTLSPTYSICPDHGYINGEEYTCPTCGRETEVYSRITGYYRPVKNWNVGKSEEFKMRKTYDKKNFSLKECDKKIDETPSKNEIDDIKADLAEPILFTRKKCPNCKMAKAVLEKAGIGYKAIDAEEEKETTLKYGVKNAPTLILKVNNGYKMFINASEIRGYVSSLGK